MERKGQWNNGKHHSIDRSELGIDAIDAIGIPPPEPVERQRDISTYFFTKKTGNKLRSRECGMIRKHKASDLIAVKMCPERAQSGIRRNTEIFAFSYEHASHVHRFDGCRVPQNRQFMACKQCKNCVPENEL